MKRIAKIKILKSCQMANGCHVDEFEVDDVLTVINYSGPLPGHVTAHAAGELLAGGQAEVFAYVQPAPELEPIAEETPAPAVDAKATREWIDGFMEQHKRPPTADEIAAGEPLEATTEDEVRTDEPAV